MKFVPLLSQFLLLAVGVVAPQPPIIDPSKYNRDRREPPERRPPIDVESYHRYMDQIEQAQPVVQRKDYQLSRMGSKGDTKSGWVETDIIIHGIMTLRIIDVAISIEHPQAAKCILYHNDAYPQYLGTVWDVTENSKYSELQRRGFLHQSYSFSPRRLTREEYPPAMMMRGFEVVAVPQSSSEAEDTGRLWNQVADHARKYNLPVRIRQVLSNRNIQAAREQLQPYIDPPEPVSNSVGRYAAPVYQTSNEFYYRRPQKDPLDTQGRYGESSQGKHGGPHRRRRDILSVIETQTNNPDPALAEAAMEQIILAAFQGTQSNVADIIWPYVMALMEAAYNTTGNDALILQAMALDLFQLTSPNMFIMGPFMMGASSMNSLLDQTNMTMNSTGYQETATYCNATTQLYGEIWGNVSAAANSTGELAQLQLLADVGSQFNSPNSSRSSIPDPDGFLLATLDALFSTAPGTNGTNGPSYSKN